MMLASPYGTIQLLRPANGRVREFLLDVNDSGSARWRWLLTSVESGTELSITRHLSVPWLPTWGQGLPGFGRELVRALDLLPRALNLKIAVLGGGTGLYTTLLGLRDRSWNLTAIISGLSQQIVRDPKDERGSLPPDDASLCLVALAPASDETMALRSLLEHRMHEGPWRGTHVGPVLLEALAETQGSMQGGLDAGTKLLGVHGRIVVADDIGRAAEEAILQADMVVVAPGHVAANAPVMARPGVVKAMRATRSIKVVVTKIMTAEGDPGDEPTTSHQLQAITSLAPLSFDAVVANSPSFTRHQLAAYAAMGAHPVLPDRDRTSAYAATIVIDELVAPGHLARHDPKRLGDVLISVGTQLVLAAAESEPNPLPGHPPDVDHLAAIQVERPIGLMRSPDNQDV
jgi:2-phospho-L-lactate transferase/gluconeogenesis factor (CofD/UPF0052 family)